MKRSILLLSSLFIAVAGKAQITVTSADMPNPNDSILVSIATGIGSADPTLTGANYTWDYSTLTMNSQRYEKYDSPFDFTSPFNLIFNPLNTSYGKVNYTLTSLPIPFITFDAAYDFYKESSTSLKQVGAGYTINGTPLPFLYTSSDIIYVFPMHYGNIDSCNFKFGLPIPTVAYYGQTGTRHSTVDGWGTVITPYGSFNALRQVSVIDATDTIYVDAFGIGSNVPRPTQYQFKWLANGKKIPVLEIDANDVGGTLTVTNVQYIDSLHSVGIQDLTAMNTSVSVFPNPANGNTHFYFNGTAARQLEIMDLSGQLVMSMNVEGKLDVDLNVATLAPGMYFYRVSFNGNTPAEKGKLLVR